MEIRQEVNGSELGDMLWSGGKEHWDWLLDLGASEDAIMSHLEEVFPDGADLTAVNDYLWFDSDSIREYLGLADWSEMEVPRDDLCEEEIERIKSDPDMKNDYEEDEIATAIKFLETISAEAEKCKGNETISPELREMVDYLNDSYLGWVEGRELSNQISNLAEFIEKVDG